MFKIIRVKNWQGAIEIAEQLTLWGFRGQEDASWELDTTLHRIAKNYLNPFDWLWHREYWMLRQFQRRAHHYCKDVPALEKKLDWLALMQHYGAATRLLDMSHSFYIAAYFALESALKDSAIWAVNLLTLKDAVAKNTNVNTSTENIDMINQRHICFVNEHISIDGNESVLKTPLVVHVEPERLHERLLIQQGFFLFPCCIAQSFVDNLATTLNINSAKMKGVRELTWDDKNKDTLDIQNQALLKIILPKEIRIKAINNLFHMNITAATLFPGLDGFARSMKYHLTNMEWPKHSSWSKKGRNR